MKFVSQFDAKKNDSDKKMAKWRESAQHPE